MERSAPVPESATVAKITARPVARTRLAVKQFALPTPFAAIPWANGTHSARAWPIHCATLFVLRFLVPVQETAALGTARPLATIKLVAILFVQTILRAAIRVVIGTLFARHRRKNFAAISVPQALVREPVIAVRRTVLQGVTIKPAVKPFVQWIHPAAV